MKPPQPDFLTEFEAADMKAAERALVGNPQAGVEVTYIALTDEGTYDPDTGQQADTTSTETFHAARSIVEATEAAQSDGALEVGDRQYLLDGEYLPRTPPSVNDRITENGTTRTIVSWAEDEAGDLFRVTAREV